VIGLIQRVSEASVWVSSNLVSGIGHGILLLVGIAVDDDEHDCTYIAQKTVNLRIFGDEEGNLNRSLIDVKGELLVVSQFTLLADTRKGRRPSFSGAMAPEQATGLYKRLIDEFRKLQIPVKEGVFGAMMEVKLVNSGPVTLIINSADKRRK